MRILLPFCNVPSRRSSCGCPDISGRFIYFPFTHDCQLRDFGNLIQGFFFRIVPSNGSDMVASGTTKYKNVTAVESSVFSKKKIGQKTYQYSSKDLSRVIPKCRSHPQFIIQLVILLLADLQGAFFSAGQLHAGLLHDPAGADVVGGAPGFYEVDAFLLRQVLQRGR